MKNQTQEEGLLPLDPGAPFHFSCHAGLSCFNHCCHDISQILYPYDILRLKNRMGLPSGNFLHTYCRISEGESSGLPVVSLKLETNRDWACPFVSPEGCRVYEDRPASCRIFPLARGLVRDRATGQLTEHYARIPDPDCLGLLSEKSIPLAQWLRDQEIQTYNRMNDAMMPLISLKNRLMPGSLQPTEKEVFITGCYDLDGFRSRILETGGLSDLFPESAIMAAQKDENALLLLGLEWVRRRLFGKAA